MVLTILSAPVLATNKSGHTSTSVDMASGGSSCETSGRPRMALMVLTILSAPVPSANSMSSSRCMGSSSAGLTARRRRFSRGDRAVAGLPPLGECAQLALFRSVM